MSSSEKISDDLNPFDRVFQPSDAELFRLLLAGFPGEPCRVWRKAYGRSGSIHFGTMVPRVGGPARAVDKDEGSWIIAVWDCDRKLRLGPQLVDSRSDGDEAIFERMPSLQGKVLQRAVLESGDLSLRLEFSSGEVLELLNDPSSAWTSEQWSITLPDRRAIIVYGHRRWALEI